MDTDDDTRYRPALDDGPFEARFNTTATDETDELEVTIPGYDDGAHTFGPVAWEPRPGTSSPVLPAAGDWALVVRSDEGRWCVLIWTPST